MDGYRFVSESDGSAPFLLEPTNRPHEREVFLAAGFTPISRYFSARMSLGTDARQAPPPLDGIKIETWDGSDPEALFRQVHDLSTQAFADNAFYKPIAIEDFLPMYMPVVPMMKADLIFFARRRDGSLAGFLFAIPNYADGPAPCSVILKTYASLERAVGRHPERVAIVDGKGRETRFDELAARVRSLRAAWHAKGIRHGDRILLAMPLDADLYASLAAFWSLGATVVLPEPAMGLAGLRHAARATRPKAVCASKGYGLLHLCLPDL